MVFYFVILMDHGLFHWHGGPEKLLDRLFYQGGRLHVAPIIFILLGDGFASRLIIAAMICYFPLLLSVVSIMSEPITDIEKLKNI